MQLKDLQSQIQCNSKLLNYLTGCVIYPGQWKNEKDFYPSPGTTSKQVIHQFL